LGANKSNAHRGRKSCSSAPDLMSGVFFISPIPLPSYTIEPY
jgi:hypothetical protein